MLYDELVLFFFSWIRCFWSNVYAYFISPRIFCWTTNIKIYIFSLEVILIPRIFIFWTSWLYCTIFYWTIIELRSGRISCPISLLWHSQGKTCAFVTSKLSFKTLSSLVYITTTKMSFIFVKEEVLPWFYWRGNEGQYEKCVTLPLSFNTINK